MKKKDLGDSLAYSDTNMFQQENQTTEQSYFIQDQSTAIDYDQLSLGDI